MERSFKKEIEALKLGDGEIFRGEGMRNPFPRMQMVDGFNEGWIDFPNCGAEARPGRMDVDSAIAALVRKETSRME